MNIGIIGAGNIGSTLARKWTALGHAVKLANSRGPETLADVAKQTGAKAVTIEDAVRDVQLIVVTIPEKNVPDLPATLFAQVPADVIVVDTGNYYPQLRDGRIEALEGSKTESAWVAEHVKRPVLKAFNSIMAPSLAEGGLPKGTPGRIALPVAGDDAGQKAKLMEIIDALGFDAVDAGSLADSWRQQPGTPVYCTDLPAAQVKEALALADRKKAAVARDEGSMRIFSLLGKASRAEIIKVAREINGAPRV